MLESLGSVARRLGGDRGVRGLIVDCKRLLSERGAANSVAIARNLVSRFQALPDEQQGRFFERLSADFGPDPAAVLSSAQAYASDPSAPNLLRLTQLAEPPRQELLRRINRLPGGTANIVAMRRALLARVDRQPELQAVEADFLHLLSSWFNPGFLQVQRVDWNSPAQLLEQIIHHEAVHEIDGWDDLRRRLQPDRRCFAFFHPQLPREPLIFVEVALLPDMPGAIKPLIDKASYVAPPGRGVPRPPPMGNEVAHLVDQGESNFLRDGRAKAAATPLSPFKVAAFYSISNCQPGLKGVSLGNFLIKRVADELKRELPQIKTFCTLSPIPGFSRWLRAGAVCDSLPKQRHERLRQAHQTLLDTCAGHLDKLASPSALRDMAPAATQALLRLGAFYLAFGTPADGGDPVARFHLDNGARLERLNPLGDLSAKGIRQSLGLMVNYLYDLHKIESHHEMFVQGEVAHSRALAALL